MSINSKQQIKCPYCGHLNDVTVWSSVTVEDSMDLKYDILKRKLNIMVCSNCQKQALLPHSMLYHDKQKKLMISFSPCSDPAEKMRIFAEMKTSFSKSGEINNFEAYNLRFVWNYDDLMEKILIFDKGLHDKVTEVLKVLILMQEPEKANDRIGVFGKIENDEIEFLIRDKKEQQFYTSRIPMSSYETIKEQLRLSGVKYKSFNWEIVDIDYGASLLRGVNNIL